MATEASRETWLSAAFERAYAWFATPIDDAPYVATRTGLGAVVLLAYLQYLPHFGAFYSPHGIGGHDTIARTPGFPGLAFQAFARFRVIQLFDSVAPVAVLYAVLMLGAVFVVLGIQPRIAGFVTGLLHMMFNAHNPFLDWGGAWLLGPFLLYLSLCVPQKPDDSGRRRVSPWGLRLLQVHVCTMYAAAGFNRLDAKGWLDGEMVLRAVLNAQFGRYEVDWLAVSSVLVLLNYVVWFLEPAAAILLWIRPLRRYVVLALIAMHLSLEALADVGWWQVMMTSALLSFLPVEWLHRLPGLRHRSAS